mmetsp:Transcript_12760/g.40466  ORF Transcript_12760/g.40466 Transcript_12760/m.40466 type:complete len:302 (+) Transcript_12760:321-1226(+)
MRSGKPPSQSATRTVGAPPRRSRTTSSGTPGTASSARPAAAATAVRHIQARGCCSSTSPERISTSERRVTTPRTISNREKCRARFESSAPRASRSFGSTTTCGASGSSISIICWIIVLTAPIPPPSSSTRSPPRRRGTISLNIHATTNCSNASCFSLRICVPSAFTRSKLGMIPLFRGNARDDNDPCRTRSGCSCFKALNWISCRGLLSRRDDDALAETRPTASFARGRSKPPAPFSSLFRFSAGAAFRTLSSPSLRRSSLFRLPPGGKFRSLSSPSCSSTRRCECCAASDARMLDGKCPQ